MNLKEETKIAIGVTSVLVLAVLSAEILSFFRSNELEYDYFSPTIGLLTWFCIYLGSQDILNRKLFNKISLISILIIIVCFLKQTITQYNYLTLAISSVPLLFVFYFKIILFLFYKDYPLQKPVIIFASRGGADYEGKDKGYSPTPKERIFSLLLFLGFIWLCVGLIFLLKKIEII